MDFELIRAKRKQIDHALKDCAADSISIVDFSGPESSSTFLDLSINNKSLQALSIKDTQGLTDYIWGVLRDRKARYGIGGYDEKRGWYQRAGHFHEDEEPRTIHLGIDIWGEPGTPVRSPLTGKIHSFKNNALFGDYGPTIILEHTLTSGVPLYSLYGHLSEASLQGKVLGQTINKGEVFCDFGSSPTNGDWPPHVHFQLMIDMLGMAGDYPGVAAESKRELYLMLCPDPSQFIRTKSSPV